MSYSRHPETASIETGDRIRTGAAGRGGVFVLMCGAVMILAAVFRVHQFSAVTSWFDESLGWRMSQFSFPEIIARSERNVHPPVHFLLLSVWSDLFGSSLLSLRSYALLWGLGTVAGAMCLVYAAMENAARSRDRILGATLAGLLVALSPLHIHWSQQIKMYSLGTCLTVWSSWLLVRWMQTSRIGHLVIYVPLAAALSLQHHYGTFTVFAQLTFIGIWSLTRSVRDKKWDKLIESVVAGWATFSLWALWLPSFLVQRNLVKSGYWIKDFQWNQAVTVWSSLLTDNTRVRLDSTYSWIVAETTLAVVLLLLVTNNTYGRFIAWLTIVPYGLALSWSVLDENVFVARFLINAQLCLLCGVGVLVYSLRVTPLQYLLSIALIGGFGYLALQQRSHRDALAAVPGMPEAIAVLEGTRGADEPVLVCNPMLYLNVCVHNQDTKLEDVCAFDPGYAFPHFQGAPVMQDDEYYGLDDLQAAGHQWVWTVDASNWLGGDWKVRLPTDWELRGEESIKEWYGTLVVRSYHLKPTHETANAGVGK